MKSIGNQFLDKMQNRLDGEPFSEVGEKLAEELIDGARERSQKGEALPNAIWVNKYGRTQAKKHGRSSPVTLRDTGESMAGMRSNKTGRGGQIRGSQKLYWHDTGEAKGRKVRQLFPKQIDQIPRDTLAKLMQNIKLILNGKK